MSNANTSGGTGWLLTLTALVGLVVAGMAVAVKYYEIRRAQAEAATAEEARLAKEAKAPKDVKSLTDSRDSGGRDADRGRDRDTHSNDRDWDRNSRDSRDGKDRDHRDPPGAKSKWPSKAAEDPFAAGVVWQGAGRLTIEGTPYQGPLELRIQKRDRDSFEGECLFQQTGNRTLVFRGSGTAPASDDGPVVFRTERKGAFERSFTGRLSGGVVTLSGNGRSDDNRSVSVQSATLKRKI